MSLCNDADLNFRAATNKQFLIELTLVKLCQLLSPSLNSGAGKGHDQLKPIAAFTSSSPATKASSPSAAPSGAHAPSSREMPQRSQAASSTASTPQPSAPAAVATHASAPVPAPKHSAPQQRHSGLMSISINPVKAPQTSVGETPTASVQTAMRRTPFTNEDLQAAWQQYINDHTKERILVNTMSSVAPTVDGFARFNIEVYDQIQVTTLNEAKPEILKFLHDTLQNDTIDFEVAIRQGEDSPATWTSRKVLEHLIETYPDLHDFVKDFNLTLG